jgi:hypothetical protein
VYFSTFPPSAIHFISANVQHSWLLTIPQGRSISLKIPVSVVRFHLWPPLTFAFLAGFRIIGVGVKFTISSLVYGLKPLAFRPKPCNKNVNFTPTPIIMHGYTDWALGWFPGNENLVEYAGLIIRAWWRAQRDGWEQASWETVFRSGRVRESLAWAWREEVWDVSID